MKGSSHIVQRKHPVFPFYIFDNRLPMLMIVEFRTQHLKGKGEPAVFCSYLIDKLYLATPHLVPIIQEAGQYMPAESELLVFALKDRAELRILHIIFELHPNGIIGIVEEYRWSLFSIFNGNIFSITMIQDNRRYPPPTKNR